MNSVEKAFEPHDGDPLQNLSEAWRDMVGSGVFLLLIRHGGAPSGAAALLLHE